MITIIKGIKVYSPKYLGIKDLVIAGGKFEGIYSNIDIPSNFLDIEVIDGRGKIVFPGFIDGHVHILGGGGEEGYNSRTPEIKFSDLVEAGITTVVGCLGTDNICRGLAELLAKAKQLEICGITTYCYTGSYDIPTKTLTSSIKSDLMLVDKFIGVGEIAISDHRSSQPTYTSFTDVLANARVGGLLSGKAGIVNVHIGNGRDRLKYLFDVMKKTEIPSNQILPTHLNRNNILFKQGLEYVKKGGLMDLTTSSDPDHLEIGELQASRGLKIYLDKKLPIENITFTSDGNGSMPIFDEDGEIVGIGICKVKSLYEEVKKAIIQEDIDIETAIKVITSNPARILKLRDKGVIKEGNSADCVIVDERSLDIDSVYANGLKLVHDGKCLRKEYY